MFIKKNMVLFYFMYCLFNDWSVAQLQVTENPRNPY
jgi:hypothetical protein